MTPRRLSLAVLILSLAVIGGALGFQYWGGLVPCELCLKERWAWYAAIPLAAALAFVRPSAVAPMLFTGLFLASSALAFYHVGVEQGWFAAPEACSAAKLKAGTPEEQLQQILDAPAVLCSEVQTYVLGLSLATWNLLASLALVGLALWTWRRGNREAMP